MGQKTGVTWTVSSPSAQFYYNSRNVGNSNKHLQFIRIH